MDIDQILGIDQSGPLDRLADYLVSADEALIHNLVTVRQQRGLSQAEVAERMGIDRSGVSKIESGSRDLLASTLRRYAMAVEAVVAHKVSLFETVDSRNVRPRYLPATRFHGPRVSELAHTERARIYA